MYNNFDLLSCNYLNNLCNNLIVSIWFLLSTINLYLHTLFLKCFDKCLTFAEVCTMLLYVNHCFVNFRYFFIWNITKWNATKYAFQKKIYDLWTCAKHVFIVYWNSSHAFSCLVLMTKESHYVCEKLNTLFRVDNNSQAWYIIVGKYSS